MQYSHASEALGFIKLKNKHHKAIAKEEKTIERDVQLVVPL